MKRTDDPALVGRHVFERAGLGLAPFRFVGMEEKTFQACPGAPIQAGSSCDYCGTGMGADSRSEQIALRKPATMD